MKCVCMTEALTLCLNKLVLTITYISLRVLAVRIAAEQESQVYFLLGHLEKDLEVNLYLDFKK